MKRNPAFISAYLRVYVFNWLAGCFLVAGQGCAKKSNLPQPQVIVPNTQHISVLTQHNNNSRSGWNEQENVLTTSTVNKSHFGKLFSLTTDDQVYAQPLVLSNILMGGKSANLVIVATVNNTVYGYYGDQGTLFWKKNYTSVGQRPVRNTDMGSCGGPYLDFSRKIGIVGTPVIDSAAQTLYLLPKVQMELLS